MDRHPEGKLWRYLIILVAIAFPLHLAWELAQCSAYFVHLVRPATLPSMLGAAAGDVLLTLIAYALVGLALGDRRWPLRHWSVMTWAYLLLAGAWLGVTGEWIALGAGQWRYTPQAPLIAGTGLSWIPVIQLLILLPASFRLAVRFHGRQQDEDA